MTTPIKPQTPLTDALDKSLRLSPTGEYMNAELVGKAFSDFARILELRVQELAQLAQARLDVINTAPTNEQIQFLTEQLEKAKQDLAGAVKKLLLLAKECSKGITPSERVELLSEACLIAESALSTTQPPTKG